MAAQAVAAAPKASPFAELLRRSKFATYDPAIRQTYKAPPANSHRGDWGLKRPISLRRKNAFISLTSFEHHAHFTEWNHAENQVRFIRRIEEMGGIAEMNRSTTWYKSLGMARTEPPFDSDFCPGESREMVLQPTEESTEEPKAEEATEQPKTAEATEELTEQPKAEQPTEQPKTVNLDSLGKRGPGAYGTQRDEPPRAAPEVFVSHNIHAMSKREFKRYLRSLRSQRSDFQGFVNAEKKIQEKGLYALAVQDDNLYHHRFLQSQMQKEYADYDDQRIAPQPHPNGALLYTGPTPLESLFWTRSKPGFYLNDVLDSYPPVRGGKSKNSIVSFGGITTRVDDSIVVGKKMLLNKTTEEGVKQEDIEESVLQLRLDPFKKIMITHLPRTVGNRPQGLKGVRLGVNLIKGDSEHMGWSNPHPIGSPDYIANLPDSKKTEVLSFNKPTPDITIAGQFTGQRGADTSALLNTLSHTIKRGKTPNEYPEL